MFKDAGLLIIDVTGVGYEVMVTTKVSATFSISDKIQLWIHEHIREDAHDLYGFASRADLKLFKKLISVSGIGPKTGLNIMTLGTNAEIEQKIEQSDIGWLSSVPGIGRKIAQKVILELKGKLVDKNSEINSDLASALISMGYSREATRTVLSSIGVDGTVEERLKKALKELARS